MARLYRRSVGWSRCVRALALLLGVLAALPGHAQTTSLAEGRRLDLYRGPLFTTSRITGLAGASAGVGVGIDGVLRNPASLANRSDTSTSWFDIDIALDFLAVRGDSIDFDADGVTTGADTEIEAVNVGLGMNFGQFAVGLFVSTLNYGNASAQLDSVNVFIGGAYAFDEGALILGAGFDVRDVTLTLLQGPSTGRSEGLRGGSFALGLLWRPPTSPWRVGGQVVFANTLEPATADPGARGLDAAVGPWQVVLGFSRFWGADRRRRYNTPLRGGPLQPSPGAAVLDRRYLMVSTDLVLVGPTTNTVNVEGFIAGDPRRSGENISVSYHLGAESELINHRLRARLGAYLEPNRVATGKLMRTHLTGGVELRLFEVLGFNLKATFAYDIAPDFRNILIGVGVWN
ncbi:MAG: hypothetical protein ACI9MR_002142 [Myxococcota bacterium]|jgi:hypothetical protein